MPRLVPAIEAGAGVATAAATARQEPERPAGERRHAPPTAAPAASIPARASGSRSMAMVSATPRLADPEPDVIDAKPAPAASPPTAAAPVPARPAPLSPKDRPLTFATPAAVPFALGDRLPPVSPIGAVALLPRRELRSPPSGETPPPAGPSVNITIGRVEVRAAVPAAAAPRAAPRPRGEAPQSLADYLKRRDRAR